MRYIEISTSFPINSSCKLCPLLQTITKPETSPSTSFPMNEKYLIQRSPISSVSSLPPQIVRFFNTTSILSLSLLSNIRVSTYFIISSHLDHDKMSTLRQIEISPRHLYKYIIHMSLFSPFPLVPIFILSISLCSTPLLSSSVASSIDSIWETIH